MPLRHQPISLPTTNPDGSYDAALVESYRISCLTPSDFPSLFGENPRLGYWELWKRKHDAETYREDGDHTAVRAFRPVITRLAAQKQRFQVSRTYEFLLHPEDNHAGAVIPYGRKTMEDGGRDPQGGARPRPGKELAVAFVAAGRGEDRGRHAAVGKTLGCASPCEIADDR